MREEESDPSFADFGGSKRLYPAPAEAREWDEPPNPGKSVVGRQGLDPRTLRLKVMSGAFLRMSLGVQKRP